MKTAPMLFGISLFLIGQVAAVELEVGASHEYLNHNLSDWKSVYLQGEHKFGDRKVVYGTLRNTARFDLNDNDWMAGVYHPIDALWTINAEAGASPTHNILPEWTAALNLHRKLSDGWGLGLGARHTEYSQAETDAALLTVERYFGAYRAAYTVSGTHLAGATTSTGHRLQLNRYYGERSTIGILLSHGQEAENVPPRGVITSQVSSVSVVGRHWLDRDWAVSYEVSLNEQGTLYTRKGLLIGLRRAF